MVNGEMNTLLQQLQQHASALPASLQAELLNYAIYLEQRAKNNDSPAISDTQRRRRLADALEKAAALNPYQAIKDPITWQREQRKDRPLPGRG